MIIRITRNYKINIIFGMEWKPNASKFGEVVAFYILGQINLLCALTHQSDLETSCSQMSMHPNNDYIKYA